MSTSATARIIRSEHQALAAVLRTMVMMMTDARHHNQVPDFKSLRAMLFYIDEFPERLHHRKEDELLFPRVRARCPELAATLDQLERDHEAHKDHPAEVAGPADLLDAAGRQEEDAEGDPGQR